MLSPCRGMHWEAKCVRASPSLSLTFPTCFLFGIFSQNKSHLGREACAFFFCVWQQVYNGSFVLLLDFFLQYYRGELIKRNTCSACDDAVEVQCMIPLRRSISSDSHRTGWVHTKNTSNNPNIYNPKMFIEWTYRFELKGLCKSLTPRKQEETLIGNRFIHCV